ncbi:MAG: SMP-30/gluconolactonase/LRE family protein [Thermoguttaceae bacterium]|jgi:sugar lactone lactonase YvrE|nr:SMP-30/gluconolactonase/LRE family protein [Thermoguttaceae bacterium]
MQVELILDAQAVLGEGPLWHAPSQRLYWVDINRHEVHVFSPADGSDRAIDVGQKVGTVVVRHSGGLALALHRGLATLDLETGQVDILCDPEADLPDNRFNDGKCDPAGRFWAGTMSLTRTPRTANLWRLDPDFSVRRMLDGVTTSNGIVWSLDRRTMYYIDTPTREVAAFDYEVETGDIANRRPVVHFPEGAGSPDGMAIDARGMLWIAHFRGGKVSCWDPRDGTMLQTIDIPASKVTACAFGGPNLDELYITTARVDLTEEELSDQPHAGGLFLARPGVPGVESFEFAG